ACRIDLVETLDRLAEHYLRFVEAALACCEATEIHARHEGERAMSRGVDCASCLLEKLAGLVATALVGEDLADVVRRHGDARDVADALEQASAPLVDVQSLLPVTLVVRLDAEVVQGCRLPFEMAHLLEERQRQSAEGSAFVRSVEHVDHVEEHVRPAQLFAVADLERLLDDCVASLDAVVKLPLAEACLFEAAVHLRAQTGADTFVWHAARRLEAAVVPADRLVVVPHVLL